MVLFSPSGTYVILKQTTAGTYSMQKSAAGGPATRLFDIDGDGDLDGICCGGGGGGGGSTKGASNSRRANFEVSINDRGRFLPSTIIPNIGARHIAGAADMDGDADDDLIGTNLLRNITFHGRRAGLSTQFGVSTSGTNGNKALLGATGPFRAGEKSGIYVRNGSGKSLAMILAGVSQVNLVDFPWNSVNTYVFPQPFQAVVPLSSVGTWSLSVRLGPGIANTTLYYQAYVLEPTAPSGIISTNGVRVRYGN